MNWYRILIGDWHAIARTVVVGILAYAALVLSLRIAGKRTLSKFNAFDFIVTVALGSTLATILFSRELALAHGITAFVLLVSLQYVITWLSVRSERIRSLVKGDPALLLYRGNYIEATMQRERVTREEVEAAARSQGYAALGDIHAAVLETDGTITVVGSASSATHSTLASMGRYPHDTRES